MGQQRRVIHVTFLLYFPPPFLSFFFFFFLSSFPTSASSASASAPSSSPSGKSDWWKNVLSGRWNLLFIPASDSEKLLLFPSVWKTLGQTVLSIRQTRLKFPSQLISFSTSIQVDLLDGRYNQTRFDLDTPLSVFKFNEIVQSHIDILKLIDVQNSFPFRSLDSLIYKVLDAKNLIGTSPSPSLQIFHFSLITYSYHNSIFCVRFNSVMNHISTLFRFNAIPIVRGDVSTFRFQFFSSK